MSKSIAQMIAETTELIMLDVQASTWVIANRIINSLENEMEAAAKVGRNDYAGGLQAALDVVKKEFGLQ